MLNKKSFQPKKVIFLDRDGVINKRPPRGEYVRRREEFEFLPGAVEALKLISQKGYRIYLITNQAGIGRGMMSEDDLKSIHQHLEEELKKNKVKISGIYYCPHEMNENCQCRKPKPGLLLQAAKEHNLDLKDTIFIGDDERDFQMGKSVGCKTILVKPEKNLLQIVNSLP